MKISREILSRIRDILKTNPRGMNVTEVSKDLGMNRLTVAKYLEMLVVSGQVDVKRFGPAKVYFISHRLPISAMLSLSSDFVIILDRNLRIINVNDKFLEFTKMSREDLLYKGITNFSFPLEFNPSIIPNIKDALEGHESIVETYYQNKGVERYYEVKFIPMVLDDGEKGVTIFIVNITYRKRAEEALQKASDELESRVKERTRELEAEIERRRKSEEALRASEEKYRSLIENIEDGVWEMDQDCRFTYMSPRMHDILGYRPEEVIGKTPYDLMQPDEMEGIRATILRIIEATGMLKLFECELLHKDGRRVPVELTASPIIDSNGVIQGYRGVTRDVTGRIKQ